MHGFPMFTQVNPQYEILIHIIGIITAVIARNRISKEIPRTDTVLFEKKDD